MWNFIKPCRPLLRSSLRYASPSRPLVARPSLTGACYSNISESKSPSVDTRQRYTAGMRPKPDNMWQLLQLKSDNYDKWDRELLHTLTYMHKWGFVVYRGTYDDEKHWTIAMRWLYEDALAMIEAMRLPQKEYDRLWDQLEYTVIDNRDLLEGATVHTVRELHRKWVLESSDSERGGPLPRHWMGQVESGVGDCRSRFDRYVEGPPGFARYGYCVYIDDKALDSIIAFKDQKKFDKDAYVRVVQTYYLDEPRPLGYDGDEEDAEIMAVLENADEPVEGITRHDVGWMKYRVQYLAELYVDLHGTYNWDVQYKRPPQLVPWGFD